MTNHHKTIPAISVGYLSYKVVNEEKTAQVIGVTSRGVFLLTPGRRIIFLSNQPYRSPLTIIINNGISDLKNIQIGMVASLSTEEIIIIEAQIRILLNNDRIWLPPPPVGLPGSKIESWQRLDNVIQQVQQIKGDQGFSLYLLPIAKLKHKTTSYVKDDGLIFDFQNLRIALHKNDFDKAYSLINIFLGLGRGLTPSGDDFLIGLLLTLIRWSDLFPQVPLLENLNQSLIESAYLKTTTISANLIECATLGYADERLIAALDGIVTGEITEQECTANLLDFGSTSGVDALAGITLAFCLYKKVVLKGLHPIKTTF